MSNAKESVKVGVFGMNADSTASVPQEMLNKQIWYSSVYNLFMILDDNRKILNQFDMERYKRFVNAHVIIYTNDGIKAYMDNVLQKWEKIQKEEEDTTDYSAYSDDYDDDYDDAPWDDSQDEYYEQVQEYDQGYNNGYNQLPMNYQNYNNRQDANTMLHGQYDNPNSPSNVKDPTRHMGIFFSLTLLLAIAIVIILNFGRPILSGIAPLLS